MDRINHLLRRSIISLIERPITNYNFVVILLLLLSRKNVMGEQWSWQPRHVFDAMPFQLLGWPLRTSLLFIPLICRAPTFPDNNLMYVLMVLYLVISNSIMLGVNVLLHCSIYPEYCYEGFDAETNDRNHVTQVVFATLQLIITVNMVFSLWFFKSIKKIIMAAMTKLVRFVGRNFYIILATGNFVLLTAHYNMQRVVIYLILLQMLWKHSTDYLLVNPIMDFISYEFSFFLEEFDETVEYFLRYQYAQNQMQEDNRLLEVVRADYEVEAVF